MKYINKLLCLLLMFTVTLSFLACKQKEEKITVCEVAHSVFYAPMYVALNNGYFKEVGLDVELVNGNGADKVMATLLSGDAQIGLMGPEASIYVYQKGQKNYAINFAQLTRTDGSFIFGREKIDNFTLDMLKGKSILGGRKGGVPLMTLEYVLKNANLLVGRDDESVLENGGVLVRTDIQFQAMAGAFATGTADFTTLFEPSATILENEGKGYLLTSVGKYAKDVPYTAFCALKEYIEENDDVIERFTKAIQKGIDYVHSHNSSDVAKAISKYFTSNTIDELTKVTERHKEINAWKDTTYFDEKSLDNLMNIMIEAKELTEKVAYDKIVTTKYSRK